MPIFIFSSREEDIMKTTIVILTTALFALFSPVAKSTELRPATVAVGSIDGGETGGSSNRQLYHDGVESWPHLLEQ